MMYRKSLIILAAIGLTTLAGCSTSSKPTTPDSPAAVGSPQPTDTAVKDNTDTSAKGRFGALSTLVDKTTAAVEAGNFEKANNLINKLEGRWEKAGARVKALSPDSYTIIDQNLTAAKTSVGGASPDKEKALQALTAISEKLQTLAK